LLVLDGAELDVWFEPRTGCTRAGARRFRRAMLVKQLGEQVQCWDHEGRRWRLQAVRFPRRGWRALLLRWISNWHVVEHDWQAAPDAHVSELQHTIQRVVVQAGSPWARAGLAARLVGDVRRCVSCQQIVAMFARMHEPGDEEKSE